MTINLTPINQLPVPDDAEAPDILQVADLGEAIDSLVMPVLSDTRLSTYAAEDGAMAFNSTYERVEVSKGSIWVHTAQKNHFLRNTQACTDTTYVDAIGMAFTGIEGHNYAFSGALTFETHENNDIKFAWDSPGAQKRRWSVPPGSSPTAEASIISSDWVINITGSGIRTYFFIGYILDVTTSGTFQLQFAKNANTETSTAATLYGYATWMKVQHLGEV